MLHFLHAEFKLNTMASRQRIRKVCLKCNQQLSYSAFIRHLNPAVCPDKDTLPTSVSIVDSKMSQSDDHVSELQLVSSPHPISDSVQEVNLSQM